MWYATQQQKSMPITLSNPGTRQMEMLCSEYTAIGSNRKHAEALEVGNVHSAPQEQRLWAPMSSTVPSSRFQVGRKR